VTDRSLAVHLYGQRIGTLVQTTGGGHFFTYAEAHVEAGSTPMSLAMPITASPYGKKRIDPFLEGLLPDNSEVRERWGRKFGVNGRNAFALLEHMGVDCAGAVEFHPDGTGVERQAVLERVSERDIAEHQEDMCQALSVYPWRKYEASGGPTAARIASLLWESGSEPSSDVPAFVRAVAFNYLMGAPDAHAKNYSLLLAGSKVSLAPLYDVASSLPYEPTTADHELDLAAMGIGGEKKFGQVTGAHWGKLARQCRVSADRVRAIVQELATDIPGALEQAKAAL
jgi:HipA-like protein